MRRRIIQWVIIFIGISLIVSLSRDVLRLIRASGQVELAEEKLAEAEQKNRELLGEKDYFNSEEFIEKEARNKLNMAKPGETIVVLPQNLAELVGRKEKEVSQEIPNWQKWWGLFFPAIKSPSVTPAGS